MSTNKQPVELLAGLSRMTVFNLHHSEDEFIIYDASGPDKDGKFCGWICTQEGRPVVNSQSIFDTANKAKAHMRSVVKACRELDVKSIFQENKS